jgi:hypothetical protein
MRTLGTKPSDKIARLELCRMACAEVACAEVAGEIWLGVLAGSVMTEEVDINARSHAAFQPVADEEGPVGRSLRLRQALVLWKVSKAIVVTPHQNIDCTRFLSRHIRISEYWRAGPRLNCQSDAFAVSAAPDTLRPADAAIIGLPRVTPINSWMEVHGVNVGPVVAAAHHVPAQSNKLGPGWADSHLSHLGT